ncbi:MAG: bifunctional phosphoribosylaminoimidazolecarboxamide formyltransferase/IMP cyclohydrolase [Promethearchaeota archaeon]|nr:MAG: bifunctional phosphoribosylaminoimidazolecarboxamide formyltransferase/IMP cyclohydrolase [Candidatus Lokiarchaeota archaeon]
MMKKIERALISVFDKKDIVEFAKVLVDEFGVEILSTGGTSKLLRDNNINLVSISEFTQSPEIFDGRVKTLHPRVEGGILMRRNKKSDLKEAQKYNIKPIDMVICNLYNFREAINKPDITLEEALEMIDIGGPTMIRAAAKNFQDVVVASNPDQYPIIIKELREKGGITTQTRISFAQEVFFKMAEYDSNIANFLQSYYQPDVIFGDKIIKIYQKVQDCRYGENWDQSAAYYKDKTMKEGIHNIKKISGKEISFNNYLDIDSCMQILLDLDNSYYNTAILKHTSPNGVAIDKKDQLKSVQMAFKTDPMSAFGGIWGLNKPVSEKIADFIVNKEKIFVEVLMAPSFETEALDILKKKEKMILLEFGDFLSIRDKLYTNPELRSVLGGIIIQEYDNKPVVKNWRVVSNRGVDEKEKEALIFAYKVSKWAKSNSACFVQTYDNGIYTIGIGAGQQSRVHVVKLAVQKAIEFGHKDELRDSLMGTDSFFPFPDGLEVAVKAGAKAIINPGGSIRDESVIEKANELNCALVFCDKRVFRH